MGQEALGTTPGDQGDDLEVAARALDGDEAAWETIVRRYYEEVWKLSWVLVRDRATAQDITQDTFLTLKRKLTQYRGACPLKHWILSICRNRCRDEFRRRQRRGFDVSLESLDQQAGGPSASARHVSEIDPEEGWSRHLDLDRALDELGEEEREAFVLIVQMGYTSAETAELMGVAPSTMRSRLGRARHRLTALLDVYRGNV